MSSIRSTRTLKPLKLTALSCVLPTFLACVSPELPSEGTTATMSFEEFVAQAHREPDTGIYIVNGDTPAWNLEQLRKIYDRMTSGQALTVMHEDGRDITWSHTQAISLTYCVSTTFDDKYTQVVNAMASAASDWHRAAHVRFIHVPAQDIGCTDTNPNVVFNVRPTDDPTFNARAFFPNEPRFARNILVSSPAFGSIAPKTLTGILRHELGHTLGFRHEHVRPEAGACLEHDSDWSAVTAYDSASVMHYPQCNGTNNGDYILTSLDKSGVAQIYGAPEGALAQEQWTTDPYYGTRGTYFADVDGDLRDDAIVINDYGVTVRRSTGSNFGAYENWTTDPFFGAVDTYFADVNGDGRADAIAVNSYGITIRRSTGSTFGAYENWTTDPFFGAIGTYFADVNGDGRADAIAVNSYGITVRRSTGTGFGAYENWTTAPFFGAIGTYFADVNGDGRADAIVVNDYGITVRRSTSTSFGAYENWTMEAYYGQLATIFADVDGTGGVDALVVNTYGITARRSTGAAFGSQEPWSDTPYYGDHGTYFADVTGDGKADAIVVNSYGVTVRRSFR